MYMYTVYTVPIVPLSFQIHQALVEESMWGNRLKGSSWRIDVKTKARHIEQLNEPTAIMEMQLGREGSEKVGQ